MTLPDMQKNKPNFCIPIHRVGIQNIKVPIFIKKKTHTTQHSVADVDVYVDLDAESKGTHMSRLAIGIQKFLHLQLDKKLLKEIANYIKIKCEAETAQVIYNFPYFINKIAPTSNEPGITHCNVIFDYTVNNDYEKFLISVETTSTSLCPCSKEISEYGAHNQRSKIKISCDVDLLNDEFIWIEDLVNIANDCSSCEIYSVLKRVDEKTVTETAYNNPAFVEDACRSISSKLIDKSFNDFKVEVVNEESIHQHEAYACIKKNN